MLLSCLQLVANIGKSFFCSYRWHEFSLKVSILNGIVMGGGAGVSIHGRFRVATENSVCVSLKPHFEVRKVFAFFSGIGGCSLVRYT
jgi:hypothetical protein